MVLRMENSSNWNQGRIGTTINKGCSSCLFTTHLIHLCHQPAGQPTSTGYQPMAGRHGLGLAHYITLQLFLIRKTIFWTTALLLDVLKNIFEKAHPVLIGSLEIPFPPTSLVFNSCHEVRQRGRRIQAMITSMPTLVYKRKAFWCALGRWTAPVCVPLSAWHLSELWIYGSSIARGGVL